MKSSGADLSSILDRILNTAADNFRIAKILIQMGLDPDNITYDALFGRLLEIVLANITLANMFALVGAIFLVATLLMQTIVALRVTNMIGCMFFAAFGALSGNVGTFILYFLFLPINAIRLRQMLNLIKRARVATEGDTSLEWLKPFMTERDCAAGEILFYKDEKAEDMLYIVSGKFKLVESGIVLPVGAIVGELGMLSPSNMRTQTLECIEAGKILSVSYTKVEELYVQNPAFGFYFLRLASARLFQNIETLEKRLAQQTAPTAEPKPA